MAARRRSLAALIAAALVLVVLVLFHKELELTSFDPIYAEALGIRTDRLRYLLLALIALAVAHATLTDALQRDSVASLRDQARTDRSPRAREAAQPCTSAHRP